MALLHDAACKQALYRLMVAQLQHDGYANAAMVVASATSTLGCDGADLNRGNRLLELVRKAWSFEHIGDNVSGELLQGLDLDNTLPRPPAVVMQESRVVIPHLKPIKSAVFSPDGQYVATGCADGNTRMLLAHKLRQGTQMGPEADDHGPIVRLYEGPTQAINTLAFHPAKPLLFAGSRDGMIRVYEYCNTNLKKPVHVYPDTFSIRSLAIHPAGRMLASATDDATLRLYDLNSQKVYTTHQSDQFGSPVNHVCYSMEGRLMGTAHMDGSIKILDVASCRINNTLSQAHGSAEVTSVQFSKSGKYLLSSGKDGQTKLWDLTNTRTPLKHYSPTQKASTAQRIVSMFSFDEQSVMVIDDAAQAVNVLESMTGNITQKLAGHTGLVRNITSSPCELLVLTCCDDGKLRAWHQPS